MDIRVIRSKRKTLCLATEPTGAVVVRAPLSVSEKTIEEFVRRHRRWIEHRLAERASSPVCDLKDGVKIDLFGRSYTIASGRTRLSDDRLFLPAEGRKDALIRLMKRETARYMGEVTKELARRYGFSYSRVRVSSARTRWGSCNVRGVVSYSFRAAFLPPELLEYLCVHELCHTRYMDHSARFWREVEQILPDWRARRKSLKSRGGYMRLL